MRQQLLQFSGAGGRGVSSSTREAFRMKVGQVHILRKTQIKVTSYKLATENY